MSEISKTKDYRYNDARRIKSQRESLYKSMDEKKKRLIKESLAYPVIDITTFMGYRGDELVEISTMEEKAKTAIETIARHLGFEVESKKDTIDVLRIYCAQKADAYDLK